MRRKDREITDIALIEYVIRNSLVCRLGMSRNDHPMLFLSVLLTTITRFIFTPQAKV
jgi:nitroimidazol reductase NimA-like FMN-containing flavoprotein (pyridoxamine 5'-phosphate oxidase superfamily)